MAQGGGNAEDNKSNLYEDERTSFMKFLKFLKSPIWLYPISRFLGHAIHCKNSIITTK